MRNSFFPALVVLCSLAANAAESLVRVEDRRIVDEALEIGSRPFLLKSKSQAFRAIEKGVKETFQHADNVAQLMQSKYKNGLIEYTDVLQAEQNRLQAQMQMIKSTGALYTDLIRFYKAIGGQLNKDEKTQPDF